MNMRLGNAIGSAGAAGAMQGAIATSMPFDYAAVFPLRGRRGNIVQDVISISPESDFVAVGMSYGFQASHVAPVAPIMPRMNLLFSSAGTTSTVATAPRDLLISTFPPDVLMDGIRLNPRTLSTMLAIPPGTSASDVDP